MAHLETKKRINLSVSKDVENALKIVSHRDSVPVATKALELIKYALELEEDIYLGGKAKERELTKGKPVSHKAVWG